MSEISDSEPEISRLALLRQRICISTWAVTLLLSLRGLFEFYGMQQKTSLEHAIIDVTNPLVGLFQFGVLKNLDIPALTVFVTALTILLISYSLRMFLAYAEARHNTRDYLARYFLVAPHRH